MLEVLPWTKHNCPTPGRRATRTSNMSAAGAVGSRRFFSPGWAFQHAAVGWTWDAARERCAPRSWTTAHPRRSSASNPPRDYAGKMEHMHISWGAAVELDPDAARLDEGSRFPLCRPKALGELSTRARLDGIEGGNQHGNALPEFRRLLVAIPGRPGTGPRLGDVSRLARADTPAGAHTGWPCSSGGWVDMLTARAWAIRATVPT